jgi:hypothetical protein
VRQAPQSEECADPSGGWMYGKKPLIQLPLFYLKKVLVMEKIIFAASLFSSIAIFLIFVIRLWGWPGLIVFGGAVVSIFALIKMRKVLIWMIG